VRTPSNRDDRASALRASSSGYLVLDIRFWHCHQHPG
jgi:hypothetical protein